MHLIVLNLNNEIIERILSYLGWRHLGIVYPMFCVLAPDRIPRLTSSLLRRCLRSAERGSRYQLKYINETSLRQAISKSPTILLRHFYEIFRTYKESARLQPFLDTYYSVFDVISPRAMPNAKKYVRTVSSIVFHPTEPIVVLVFNESTGSSFSVYAYAGSARAKKGLLLYHHRGGMKSCTDLCSCCDLIHFMQVSWSPGGSKLCCLEACIFTCATLENTIFANFFVLNPTTFDMRRIDNDPNQPDVTIELVPFGRHRIHNITLWATDDDFYYPEVWLNRDGFSMRHLKIAYSTATNNVTLTRLNTGIIWGPERPNLFTYPAHSIGSGVYQYCNVFGSLIPHETDFAIPYGFWLINKGKVLFTCEDCPNSQHIPHSILRRQAVLLPDNTFPPDSGIVFKNHRIQDAAPLSTDPSYLLLLLSCDSQCYTPWCTTARDCMADWEGSRYEPLTPDSYSLGSNRISNDCRWGTVHSGEVCDGEREIKVFLGIIRGESADDRFRQIAIASLSIRGGAKHQYQLQIFGQSDNYVLIKECCDHRPQTSNNLGPRIFLFSKLLNECIELTVDKAYYPHPKNDIFLYFNFQSRDPRDYQSIVVFKSVIASDDQQFEKLEYDRFLAFGTLCQCQCSPCPNCSFYNSNRDSDFNMPIKPVRINNT